jgi:hypothetical protein
MSFAPFTFINIKESSSKVGVNGFPVYQYSSWPAVFDSALFCCPRPLPKNIAREFERRSELKKKLTTIAKEIRAEREIGQKSLLSVMAREIKEERGY